MPEVTLRRTGELIRILFQILLEHPQGLPGRDVLAKLRSQVKLTEHEKGRYESGGLRFDQIVRFATVDASKAGWLLKQKGQWAVTDQGRQAFAEHPDPGEFYRLATKLYREWRGRTPVVSPEGQAEQGEGIFIAPQPGS